MTLTHPTTTRLALVPLLALAMLASVASSADAKADATFAGRILTIEGGNGDDQVAVACAADGTVKVNGADPKDGPVACANVVEIDSLTGPGNDLVDYTGIGQEFGEARFPGFGTRTGAAAILGSGTDRYIGSAAAFNLVDGEDGNDVITGGNVRDQLGGGEGDDLLRGGEGRDSLLGNRGADRLFGEDGADVISGHADNDFLSGGAGADVLGGGAGRDLLRGGPGRDKLLGGLGRDRLAGGPGKDIEREKPPAG